MNAHSQSTIDRLWSKIDRRADDECWPWTSTTNGAGYGRVYCSETKKWLAAHRVSYEVAKGHIEAGMQIRHLCHNRLCCNPVHLEQGTAKDNAQDSLRDGNFATGARNGKAKLDEYAVNYIRDNPDGEPSYYLAEKFNVSEATISNIRNWKVWTRV